VVTATRLDQGQQTESAQHRQLKSVAAQFEAVLLENLIGGLQKTFSSLGNDKDFGVSSTYDYLGREALASAWAQAGGIGLARMISTKWMKDQ